MKTLTIATSVFLLIPSTRLMAEELPETTGWMHGNCLAIRNADIPIGQKITIIDPEDSNGRQQGHVIAKALSGDNCYALQANRAAANREAGYSFYLVETKEETGMAIATTDTTGIASLSFSYCMTSEGVSFRASKGNEVLWQGYYYLGYEMEPTCGD